MSSRLISIVLFLLALVALIFSNSNTFYPLFMFLSDHPLSGTLRLAIAASLLAVTSRKIFFTPGQKLVLQIASVILIMFGLTTLFSNSLGWTLYAYLMPLDSLLLTEAGILFSLAALNAEVAEKPQERQAVQPRIYRLQLRSKTT